ncbi:preprotein translocase subunit YajC [Ghiorsea bivora]|uniref:preprotein translocase subunit YajC n=1 Tax=Ghiorsea bivora TaxID=1485545 RepID=UPI001E2F7606|nr:preprotein translocase subunit YajC [Ghiorsea bivora]
MKTSTLQNMISKAVLAFAVTLLPANLAHAEAAGGGGGFASLIPLILIMVIFWVLLIRPQQKRMKEHAELIKGLKKGDKVVTGGGIYGRITNVKDGVAMVEITEGVIIKTKQDTIAGLQESPKTQDKKDKKDKKGK